MYGGGCGGGGGGGEGAAGPAIMAIRKGPWMAEEDAVLLDYVRKHGPRDWSSIRSKGLLPRTGKSCRLRWVNKLKPDLKTGCKFTAEEERIVIDLQARFGNKWARIATYLPGRTDNDVKNFWSTRQKRLARLLQSPLPTRSHRNHGKLPISHEHPLPTFQQNENPGGILQCDPSGLEKIMAFAEECSNGECSNAAYSESQDGGKMAQLMNLDAGLSLLEPAISDREICLPLPPPPTQPALPPFENPLLDIPLLPPLPENQNFSPEFCAIGFPDPFVPPTFYDMDFGCHGAKVQHPVTPESFFDDFPTDMFDCTEQPPAT